MDRKLHRQRLEFAIKWLDIMDTCDENIKAGNNAYYFRHVKKEAEVHYAEAFSTIVQPAVIEAAQYNIVA